MNRSPTYHSIKIWSMYFKDVITGKKTFEYRLDDRGYLAGDHLILREWIPFTREYTGRYIECYVPYLYDCGNNYVIMSIWRESDVKYDEDFAGVKHESTD